LTPDPQHRTTLVLARDFGVSYFVETPFLHVHYCFLDSEAEAVGYTAHEFCCHLCGKSLLVFADFRKLEDSDEFGVSHEDQIQMSWLFTRFSREHQPCHMTGPPGQSQMYREVFEAALDAGDDDVFCSETRTQKATRDLRTVEVLPQ